VRQGLLELHQELASDELHGDILALPRITPRQRQLLRRIADRGAPLWERVPCVARSSELRRLERWREVLGGTELLERRMRSTPGLTPESLLAGTDPARLPRWAHTLAHVMFESGASSTSVSGGVPFKEILEPFVAHARRRFRAEARSTHSVLSSAAVAAIERELVEHLSLVASLALGRMFYEFRFARAPLAAFEELWTRQPRSTAIYSEFVAHLSGDGLVELFERHPVLGRLLAQSVDLWVTTSARLCRRFTVDWPRLHKFFAWTGQTPEGMIAGIKTGLSDRHAGGQTVAELTLATGERVIYKPRSVRPEIAFNTFLEWLNDRDLPLHRIPKPAVIRRVRVGAHECIVDDIIARVDLAMSVALIVIPDPSAFSREHRFDAQQVFHLPWLENAALA